MTTYGLTPTGFVPKTTEVILDETEADQLGTVDATLVQAPDEPLGQFNGIFAGKCAELWELMATMYKSLDPDQSENAQLDAASSLTGTKRKPADRSLVTCTVNLDASKTFTPGQLIANVNGQPAIKFRNRDTVTSTGAGNYSAVFESVDLGPVPANASTLTVITTPVSGWNSITNPADAVLGHLIEVDTDLRVRRRTDLAKPGACTLDSVRADVLQVKNVLQCIVLENNTMAQDLNGLPPKSFNVVIYDETPAAIDADVAQTIWNSKPSGIQPYGATNVNVKDSLGATHVVGFSRSPQKTVYFSLTVVTDPNTFPADGSTQIKNALVALGKLSKMGDDVIAARYKAEPIIKVAGVVDVTVFTLGFTASPAGTANLAIAPQEQATFDTSRVVVTVT